MTHIMNTMNNLFRRSIDEPPKHSKTITTIDNNVPVVIDNIPQVKFVEPINTISAANMEPTNIISAANVQKPDVLSPAQVQNIVNNVNSNQVIIPNDQPIINQINSITDEQRLLDIIKKNISDDTTRTLFFTISKSLKPNELKPFIADLKKIIPDAVQILEGKAAPKLIKHEVVIMEEKVKSFEDMKVDLETLATKKNGLLINMTTMNKTTGLCCHIIGDKRLCQTRAIGNDNYCSKHDLVEKRNNPYIDTPQQVSPTKKRKVDVDYISSSDEEEVPLKDARLKK